MMSGLSDPEELLQRFWSELGHLRTGMLGLATENEAHAQPMTAHFEGAAGPLWFFARKESGLAHGARTPHPAVFHYVGRGHELYACVHGDLAAGRDVEAVKRFWEPEVERWFKGPGDPDLVMLRFSPVSAQIWLPNHGPDAQLFGFDRRPASDIHAEVRL
jgi:general stress protein 26